MKYDYYYNHVPDIGKTRNNLVYTSLISQDQKTFVQWFYNDGVYHQGMNEVVDPELMDQKWEREVKFLSLMQENYKDLVPEILDIDYNNKKIYLKINGVDFWQMHFDQRCEYDAVLADWEEQMLEIVQAHKDLKLWKYSMHPSSYFLVDGRLKSINYFFSYHDSEPEITIEEHRTHISLERQKKLEPVLKQLNLNWTDRTPFRKLQILCFESFRSNYPDKFIEKAKAIFD